MYHNIHPTTNYMGYARGISEDCRQLPEVSGMSASAQNEGSYVARGISVSESSGQSQASRNHVHTPQWS